MLNAHASGDQDHMNSVQFSGLAPVKYKEGEHYNNWYDPSRDKRTGGYI